MKKPLMFFILILPFVLWAESSQGDKYPEYLAPVFGTGSIGAPQPNTLTIEKMSMSVTVSMTDAQAHIEYTIDNPGQAFTDTLAFPIFYAAERIPDDVTPESDLASYRYSITLNGSELQTKMEPSPGYDPSADQKYFHINGYYPNGWTKKQIGSAAEFPAHQTSTVKIDYTVPLYSEKWTYYSLYFPYYNQLQFHFDFRSSAVFGNGIIRDFQLRVDYSALSSKHIPWDSIETPAAGAYTDDGKVYTCALKDIDCRDAPPLYLAWDPPVYHHSQMMTQYRLKPSSYKKISASSTLPAQGGNSYAAKNIFDGKLDTCWCENVSGQGVGEWVEAELKPGTAVGWIGIIGGYVKNQDAYTQNSRPKTVTLELYYYPDGNMDEDMVDKFTVEIPELPFHPVYPDSFARMVYPLYDPTSLGISLEPYKIRLKIDSVYPGTKYSDTAITELILMGSGPGH